MGYSMRGSATSAARSHQDTDLYSAAESGTLLAARRNVIDSPPRTSAIPAPRPSRRRLQRRAARFIVILVGVILLGNALVGERGLMTMVRANRDFTTLSQMITALRAENEELREEAREFLEEPRMIEDLARRDLGLIEPGEILFIVTTATADTPANDSRPTTVD